jgi:WD repeat-containing protein 35
VGTSRVWMNVSQEGKDDLDDLRGMKLLNTIKLSTSDHGLVVGYQISFKGQKLLKRKLTQSSQDAVNSFCFTADGDPLHVGIEGQEFYFYTQDREYRVPSKVTDTEDVSYVSSPYLPECLRRGLRGMTSNAHRAYESAAGKSATLILIEILFLIRISSNDSPSLYCTGSRVVVIAADLCDFCERTGRIQ